MKQATAGANVTVAAITAGNLLSHTHASPQISDATANATASTVVMRDPSGGANFAYAAVSAALRTRNPRPEQELAC